MHGCVHCAYVFVASEHHVFANKANTLYYKNSLGSLEELEIVWEQMPYTLSVNLYFYNTVFPLLNIK